MKNPTTYTKNEATAWPYPNYWDGIALCLVLGIIIVLGWGAKEMTTPYHLGQPIAISLDPKHLPYYALRSVLRMLSALVFSLLFTFIFGTWAAKSKYAERIIIPIIDVLQSVPVLGFLTITSTAFIALFSGSMLGPELMAIFAIFVAQVWNMTLSFYQSVRTVPAEFIEAADMLRLSAWQRFWRIDVPFAMPGLLWNTMLSMSASWFFVVASEAFTVANQNINLPGIGSYISVAIRQANKPAITYAIIAMFIVILLYDQIIFRPLIRWAEKFKAEQTAEERTARSWLIYLFQRTKFLSHSKVWLENFWDKFVNFRWFNHPPVYKKTPAQMRVNLALVISSYTIFFLSVIVAILILLHSIFVTVKFDEILHVFFLGFVTGFKVMVLILLCSIIWIPIGVWIGLRERVSEFVQPMVQFLAAFPANLLFPIVVIMIIKYHLNVDVWTAPLMLLGTQWYILFNVIAGAAALPKDLKQVAESFHIKGWLWWARLILPGIFPYYLTGAITAAGGAWNVSIVAEVVSWGNTKLQATGLGAYITQNSNVGDFPRLALGIAVMTIYVLVINRLIWRPLYNLVRERYQLG